MTSSWDARELECFLAVAEHKHFRRAAGHLHLSPASVSEAIARLERRLGGRLFDRSTRQVQLTEHGERFLHDVREPYRRVLQAHESARARTRQRDCVVIACTPELGHLFLPSLLAYAPRAEGDAPPWRPLVMHTADQLREIKSGAVDVGLCWSVTAQEPLAAVALADVPVVAVLREDDVLAAWSELPLAELRDRRILVTPRQDNAFIETRRWSGLLEAGLTDVDLAEVGRFDELVLQVAASDRVGLHPGTLPLSNRIPGVVFRRVVSPDLTETICAVTHSAPRHPAVGIVLSRLAETAAELGMAQSGVHARDPRDDFVLGRDHH